MPGYNNKEHDMTVRKSVLAILAGCLAVSLVAGRALADNEKGTAVIKGKAVFVGEPEKPRPLPPMNSDQVCASKNPNPVPEQGTIIYTKDGNKIPYVFVAIKSGLKGKYDAPADSVILDQRGCMYHPHVFGMVAGQQLDIKSSDETAHNIHALPKKNTEFNISQPKPSTMPRKGKDTFTKPESPIKIKCDVHGWMSAWCHVMEHPFFDVTKDHMDHKDQKDLWGTFEIKNLPAGDYEVEAWHENFGTVNQKVSVKDGETKEITFEFKKPAKKADAGSNDKVKLVSASEATGKSCCKAKAAAAVASTR
jgi:hypothetical protein